MTTQTTSLQPATSLLRRALIGNSIFSTVTGGLLLLLAGTIAEVMGLESAAPLTVLGLVILPFAAGLYYMATRPHIHLTLARFIVVMDFAWVVVSALVLVTNAVPLTSGGRWIILILADLVLVFAVAQVLGLRRLR